MESFTRYLNTLPEYSGQLFASNPPSTALLLWSIPSSLPSLHGVTFVSGHNSPYQSGFDKNVLKQLLKAKLDPISVPVIDIIYDFNLRVLNIDGVDYDLQAGATIMATILNVKLGNAASKAPNNPHMISDPFHIWSRNAFDGIGTRKADVDLLILKENRITKVVEVKRSDKRGVGKWNPYITSDRANYLLQIEFARILEVDFLTVHHEFMNSSYEFTGEERIDVFPLKCPTDKVNDQLLQVFSADNNRIIGKVNDLVRR
jgi:hypothetical protein